MEYLLVLIPVVAGLIVSFLLERRADTCEKTDKGIEIWYWKLSYRRKFIRTLWMIPIDIALIMYYYITFQNISWTCIFIIVSGILFFIQAVDNYRKWKRGE